MRQTGCFRPRRVHPRKWHAVRRLPKPGAVRVTDGFDLNAIPPPLERSIGKTKDGIDRGGGDDEIGRNPTGVCDDFRLFALDLDVMDDHAVSDIKPIQHLLEEGVKSASRVEVRGLAWKAELSDLGDPLKSAELAPDSGHLLKPESPELLVEAVERERRQVGPDRRFEVVAEIPLCGRRLCPFDLGQLAFDLLATGKLTEALVIDGKRYDRIFRSEASSLVDLSLLEIDEAFQERNDLLVPRKTLTTRGPYS